ncbi:MAG: glycosyltransferase family 39 protein [Actinomycetota bacterium]
MTTTATSPSHPQSRDVPELLPRSLARRALAPLAIFLASRVVTLVAAYAGKLVAGKASVVEVLAKWDGDWYLGAAIAGYPNSLPTGRGPAAQTTLAFFPGYPVLIRFVSEVTGLGPPSSGVLISIAAGSLAAVVIWLLARQLLDEDAALRAVALWSFFPGSFVLSMVYAEGVFVLAAAACLLALLHRRWLLAGLAAAAASAVRPNGIFLAACCLWAAGVAIKEERAWKALAAPLIAPLGALAFFTYLWRHTGNPLAWPLAQQRGWGQGIDFGLSALRNAREVLLDPLGDFNLLVSTLSLVALVPLGVALWRWRPPFILVIYAAGMVLPFVLSPAYYFTPRSILMAFPLLLAGAREVRGAPFLAILGLSAALMPALLLVAGTTIIFTP